MSEGLTFIIYELVLSLGALSSSKYLVVFGLQTDEDGTADQYVGSSLSGRSRGCFVLLRRFWWFERFGE